jgi:streptogrisin D
MTPTRSHVRVITLSASAVVVLGGAIALTPLARAASTPDQRSTVMAAPAATALSTHLGDHSAGVYRDRATGQMVVTVTDEQAARTVRAAGAVAKVVAHSGAQLAATKADLARTSTIPGTAWAVDVPNNQVLVSADSTVSQAQLDQIAARYGDRVRVRRATGKFTTKAAGGDAIFGGQFRCSLGFNVHDSAGRPAFLTAGHCGNDASEWFADGGHTRLLGSVVDSTFPGEDHALVRYASGAPAGPSSVNLYNGSSQRITGAADAVVGERVTRSGSTSHVHSGSVEALDATVNYQEGTVNGLIQTNVCAEGGDSGGALFDGSDAIGLTSGGSGDCEQGGETFFQPVPAALDAYGATIG